MICIDWTLGKFARFCKDLWTKQKCFVPVIANIFDQSSDIGFILGMYNLMRQEMNGQDCPDVNATYLFVLSVAIFSFYRIVSGVMVFIGTKNGLFGFGQFLFEYMLYRAIWVNYKMKCTKPCSPQCWKHFLN